MRRPRCPQRHKERVHCDRTVISQGRGRTTIKGHDRSNSQVQARMGIGRGDSGCATIELRLNNYDYCAKPGPGLRRTAVATAAERLPVCACRTKQTACWMSRQIQVNSRDNCDGAATSSARQLQWHLPPGRNRTPLKGVTVSQSLYPLTPQSRGPAPLLL